MAGGSSPAGVLSGGTAAGGAAGGGGRARTLRRFATASARGARGETWPPGGAAEQQAASAGAQSAPRACLASHIYSLRCRLAGCMPVHSGSRRDSLRAGGRICEARAANGVTCRHHRRGQLAALAKGAADCRRPDNFTSVFVCRQASRPISRYRRSAAAGVAQHHGAQGSAV
jgi:hypothetical protein